jgi:DNA polymerase
MLTKKEKELEKLKKQAFACRKCVLYKKRTAPVIGQGSLNAKIIFIGEAPGAKEDATGVPFCGRSGKFLDELLKSAEIDREKVYICNIVNAVRPRTGSERERDKRL